MKEKKRDTRSTVSWVIQFFSWYSMHEQVKFHLVAKFRFHFSSKTSPHCIKVKWIFPSGSGDSSPSKLHKMVKIPWTMKVKIVFFMADVTKLKVKTTWLDLLFTFHHSTHLMKFFYSNSKAETRKLSHSLLLLMLMLLLSLLLLMHIYTIETS